MAPLAQRYAQNGWLALTYDARGFGESEGYVELNGPNEVGDVSSIIDYIAQRGDVLMDGPMDPRVATRGLSYGGAIQLLAAAEDPRIDALVPRITWNNLVNSLAPEDAVKMGWVALFYASGQAASAGLEDQNPNAGTLSPELSYHLANVVADGGIPPETREYLEERSPSRVIGDVKAPTLLVQGWQDTLFTPLEATRTLNALIGNGVPAQLIVYRGGHGYDEALADNERESMERRIDAWLAYWLNERGSPDDVYAQPVLWWNHASSSFIPEQSWPLVDAQPLTYFMDGDFVSGRLVDVKPAEGIRYMAGGSAGGYSEFPYVQPYLPAPGAEAPATALTYETEPFDEATQLVGVPRLVIHAATTGARSHWFAKAYDVAADDSATLINRQVDPLEVVGTQPTLETPREVAIDLTPIGHTFAPGHRMRLVVSTSDAAYLPDRSNGAHALYHGFADGARLELSAYPAQRAADTNAPTVSVQRAERVGRDLARVAAQVTDDFVVANAYVFWQTQQDFGVATSRAQGDEWVFQFDVPRDEVQFRIVAADAAGNHADWGPSTIEASPGRDPGLVPGPGVLLVLLGALAAFGMARRR